MGGSMAWACARRTGAVLSTLAQRWLASLPCICKRCSSIGRQSVQASRPGPCLAAPFCGCSPGSPSYDSRVLPLELPPPLRRLSLRDISITITLAGAPWAGRGMPCWCCKYGS